MAVHLLAVAYERKEAAQAALACLRDLEREHALELKDAALATRGDDGKVVLDQTRQLSVGDGLVGGGSLGLLLGIVVGVPVAGALVGMTGGGGITLHDRGISDDQMKRVAEKLELGHAAVFALATQVDWERVRAALAPLGGELLAAQVDDVVIASLGAGTSTP